MTVEAKRIPPTDDLKREFFLSLWIDEKGMLHLLDTLQAEKGSSSSHIDKYIPRKSNV